MSYQNVIGLLGGLGLFLFGMNIMSSGLELAAGNRLKSILEKLTANRFVGVGVGALVAALTQSSSATTVMAIGFVNSGIMSLESAVWIIMGANIGTTITGQLIALNFSAYSPLLIFIGVAMVMMLKRGRAEATGQVLIGLGMLFMGLEQMSHSMVPLRTMPEFAELITKFQNPIIGILVGAIFTALIQSSSASVGILQSLAVSGVITLPSAIYVLFGQNIGTCITAVLASIGAERNAKRATLIHLMFNLIGTAVFIVISLVTPFTALMASLTPNSVPTQIANVHTVFNVVTTLLLLPFGAWLVKITYRLLPDRKDGDSTRVARHLDFNILESEYHVGTTTLAGAQLFRESQYMLETVLANVTDAFSISKADDIEEATKRIRQREEVIDELNQQIIQFTARALTYDVALNSDESNGGYVQIAADLERIGDHAMNIMERLTLICSSKKDLSEIACNEINHMKEVSLETLRLLRYESLKNNADWFGELNVLEQDIDKLYAQYERRQLRRLKDKECSIDNSVHFAKILTDFERIGDHCLNIGQHLKEIQPQLSYAEFEI